MHARWALPLVFVMLGCACSPQPRPSEIRQLVDRTVEVDMTVEAEIEGQSKDVGGTSTGVIVGKTNTGGSLVLTAGHSCRDPHAEVEALGAKVISWRIDLVDFWGVRHRAEIVLADTVLREDDLCLLSTADYLGSPVPVASAAPAIGDRIQNMGSPHGMMEPGVAIITDGYICGTDSRGFLVVSIPAAPGSSGSGVFWRGRLVGIVVRVHGDFEHGVLAVDLAHVRRFMSLATPLLS